MLTRLRQRISQALTYHRKGDVEFKEIKAEGDRVKVVITLESVGATIILRLTPESAWLVGNKIVDEAHAASTERAGDPA